MFRIDRVIHEYLHGEYIVSHQMYVFIVKIHISPNLLLHTINLPHYLRNWGGVIGSDYNKCKSKKLFIMVKGKVVSYSTITKIQFLGNNN